MKTKKLSKKLSLQKQTISNLRDGEMKIAQGGIVPVSDISYCQGCNTALTCETCAPKTCGCNQTYETCNPDMCTTVYPFPC